MPASVLSRLAAAPSTNPLHPPEEEGGWGARHSRARLTQGGPRHLPREGGSGGVWERWGFGAPKGLRRGCRGDVPGAEGTGAEAEKALRFG